MADQKHTPGPWTVEPFSNADKAIIILEPRATVDNDDVDHAEAAANARLIAAAPDLLGALQMLHDNIAEYARINNLGGFDNHDMRMARAALSAASGRAPTNKEE